MTLDSSEVRTRIAELGPWFHNMILGGVATAPQHFLGDYPTVKWRSFEGALPRDLRDATVLDIGCNGGFYALEMKRRGATRVVGIDSDPGYLAQAAFAVEMSNLDIELRQLSVYDVALLRERFDIVLFMGVLYHLRHPLLALDLIHEHVSDDLLVFQTMLRGQEDAAASNGPEADYPFAEVAPFARSNWPRLHFVEGAYAGDPTNWWIPNAACAQAMLRSAGFEILARPESEVFICRHIELPDPPDGPRAVHPASGASQ